MFSALLQRCDVARSLLPILTEPLRSATAAVAGACRPATLSDVELAMHQLRVLICRTVPHRRLHSRHTKTFLEILCEVSRAALAEASSMGGTACGVEWTRHLAIVTHAAVIAADAAAPLVSHAEARCTVLVLDTVTNAVRTIALANAVVQQQRDGPGADGARPPLPPLLPYVHSMWPFYVAAVAGDHAVAALHALERLPEVALSCGGDFLRQRFASDLWPPLSKLLQCGCSSQTRSPQGDAAPGSVARMQHASVACLKALAVDASSRDTLADAVGGVAEALAAVMRTAPAPTVVRDAGHALDALAALDADAVWLVRLRAGRVKIPCCPLGAGALLQPVDGGRLKCVVRDAGRPE
jgi:hypothetical protein